MTLEQATNEIRTKLQQDHTRDMMDKLNSSFKIETNDTYFPGGVSAAPPPRVPRPRPGMPPPGAGPNGAPPTQPQTPPPAQPPAPKPN
jgi:hypothetical protein